MRSIVVVGAGAAGLSFAYYLSTLNSRSDFSCILIDPDTKQENDRTWAFWGDTFDFDALVEHRWDLVTLSLDGSTVDCDPAGYRCIPSDKFYAYCLNRIRNDSRFSLIRARVEHVYERDQTVWVRYRPFGERAVGENQAVRRENIHELRADYALDTVFGAARDITGEALGRRRRPLRQSFVGWEVVVNDPFWDPSAATLMEFSTDSRQFGLEFYYALPTKTSRALVEYTTVDESVPDQEYLEHRLEQFLVYRFGADSWSIVRREKGTIPLFEATGPVVEGRVAYLGVASGAARPSTGYAFRTIVETSKALAESLTEGNELKLPKGLPPHCKRRPRFYDRVFLELLRREPQRLPEALFAMFQRNPGGRVFDFLGGKTSFLHEIPIVRSLPWPPFLRALARRVVRPLMPNRNGEGANECSKPPHVPPEYQGHRQTPKAG